MISKPRIVGFVCSWSLPKELGTTSPSAMRAYPKMRVVKVRCVGRLDPVIVLETFTKGADGVLIIGCRPPDCHYVDGNLQAERKIMMLSKLMSLADLEPERLRLEWAYASEIERFVEIIDDFRNTIMVLGSSPLAGRKADTNMLLNLKAAKAAAEGFRLRVLVGRERELTDEENAYGERISPGEFDVLLHEIAEAEFVRHKIHLLIKEKPMSVRDIASRVNMKPAPVLRHIVNMRSRGMITLDRVKSRTPLYRAMEV